MSSTLTRIWSLFENERPLFLTGLLGLGLGAVCFAATLHHGVMVEPEGNLVKAGTFNGAVGLFLITLALIVPLAGFSKWGHRTWRWSLVGLTLFGYSVETIQIFRGLDPRFSRVGTPTDRILGGIFFLSAVAIMVCFLVLTLRFFFRSTAGTDGPLVVALRYGTLASMLGFTIGIVMSALSGPTVPEAGNLLPLHAAGFHGIQAVPLVALLWLWSGSAGEARVNAHRAGIAWLFLCAAIAVQSFSGRPVLSPSLATGAAALALGFWAVLFARALAAWHRSSSGLSAATA